MKLKKLIMQGFGSFAGTETIDFENMKGLWLVSGDTGAGKTTIFDAITFALFGEASDKERLRDNSSKGLRSDYLTDDEKSEVTLVFEQDGRTWTVTRSPKWQKEGRKADVPETAVLTTDGDEPAVSKPTQVNERISKLIHIDVNQFRQLAMIAQNDFEKLVTESSDDRQKLLRKLLMTERYFNFERLVKEKNNAAKREYAAAQEAARGEAARYEWDAQGLENAAVKAYFELKGGKGEWTVSDEVISEMKNQLIRLNAALSEAKASEDECVSAAKTLAARRESEQALHSRFVRLNTYRENEAKYASAETTVAEQERLLERRSLAFDVKALFDSASETGKQAALAANDAKKKAEMLEDCTGKVALAEKNAERVPELAKTAEEFSAEIKRLRERSGVFAEFKKAQQAFTVFSAKSKAAKQAEAELLRQEAEGKARLNALRVQAGRFTDLTKLAAEKDKDGKQLKERVQSLRELTKFEAEYTLGAQTEEQLRKAAEQALAAYTRANAAYLGSCRRIVAEELKEGCPCPICGSIAHPAPYVFTAGGTEVSAEDVNSLMQKNEDAQKALIDCRAHRTESLKTINALREKLELSPDSDAKTEFKNGYDSIIKLKNECDRINAEAEAAGKASEAAQKLEKELEALSDKRIKAAEATKEAEKNEAMAEALLRQQEALMPARTEEEHLKNITEAESGYNKATTEANRLTGSRETAVKNLAAAKAADEAAQKALKAAEEADKKARLALELALTDISMSHEEALKLMPAGRGELDSLRDRLTRWKADRESNLKLIAEAEAELSGKTDPDFTAVDEQIKNNNLKLTELKSRIESRADAYHRNQTALNRTLEAMEDMRLKEERFRFYGDLAQVISGGRGKNENLEVWLQRYYFERVIKSANHRFRRLTNELLELRLSPEGLDLNVHDRNTGRDRAVNTLSGGEKFKAALSMALGMSDMIQAEVRNIDLGMLFIDEGFGTLDADSINQAIGILEDLSDNTGRLVAVISHREEMRKGIDHKLTVRKHKDDGVKRGSYIVR